MQNVSVFLTFSCSFLIFVTLHVRYHLPFEGLAQHCSLVSPALASASKLHQTNLHFKVVSSYVQTSRALVALRSADLILK